MSIFSVLLVLAAADPDDGLAKTMRPIYVQGARTYSLAVESAPRKELELKEEPIFEWINPVRKDTQGALFVWLRDGRPAALACIFSHPHPNWPGRVVRHELHALDPEKLVVTRDSPNQWKPEVGLARKDLLDAAPPAATSAARAVQIRRLAQEFAGYSVDRESKRWELRLLPTPLYRYPSARTGVVDGAVFALMSGAGTDPEVLLVVEARESEGKLRWEYACGRFSDWELRVRHKDEEVFAYVPSEASRPDQPKWQLYRIYAEKVVSPEGKLLARVQPNTNGGTDLVPIEDK